MQIEFIKTNEGWEIWTPDITGACIGQGKTKEAAMSKCAETLCRTAGELIAGIRRERLKPNETAQRTAGENQSKP